MNKHSSLQKVYYASFASMVVVPILLVFIVSLSVIRLMMQDSAVSAIRSRQNEVISSLNESVKDASLQLSHFVYVNNNEVMEAAAMTDTEDTKVRHTYTSYLDELFQVAMAPKQTVISGMIYMKDGRYTYLKQELAIPREQVTESQWYQKALQNRNTVTVGCYDTSNTKVTMTGSRSRELILSVALAPDIGVDRSGKIDMIVLFFRTRVGELLNDRGKNEGLGDTVLLDQNGSLLFQAWNQDSGPLSLGDLKTAESGVYRRKLSREGESGQIGYTCVVSRVPDTGWRVVSCVETSSLTGDFNRIALFMLVVIGSLFLLYGSFSRFFLQNIIQPVQTMVEGLRQVEGGDLETHIDPAGQAEIRQMIHSFNRMVRQLKTSVEESEAAQRKKLEAEVRALQSQINPHFLVNTLNSIRFMAQVSKFEGIRRMAEALIRILTCSFRSNSSFYSVKEELDVLDSYLYLMKIRYSDGFEVSYEVDPSCLDYQMPRLVLQPIVENSIVHGFADMEEEMGQLIIRVGMEGDKLYLEVWDNGSGMTEESIAGVLERKERSPDDNYSIGIENVCSRLQLHFKEEFHITMKSKPGSYTRTRLVIPAVRKEEESHESGGDRG